MKKAAWLLTLIFMTSAGTTGFLEQQLKHPRVAEAYALKGPLMRSLLKETGISDTHFDLFIRAFKTEKVLEVWAKNKTGKSYRLLKTYDFCAISGLPGPKRKSGDLQIPEGFYKTDAYNPQSNYHLSFRINYPNASDKKLGDPDHPGGDIYIHGNCVTVGCIPVGDDAIRELYLLAILSANGGGRSDVHIFPARMDSPRFKALYESAPALLKTFWEDIKPGYLAFESSHNLPVVRVNPAGRYEVHP